MDMSGWLWFWYLSYLVLVLHKKLQLLSCCINCLKIFEIHAVLLFLGFIIPLLGPHVMRFFNRNNLPLYRQWNFELFKHMKYCTLCVTDLTIKLVFWRITFHYLTKSCSFLPTYICISSTLPVFALVPQEINWHLTSAFKKQCKVNSNGDYLSL